MRKDYYRFEDFVFIKLLSNTGNGKVYMVENIKDKEIMVMKSVRKEVLIEKDNV